MPQSSQRETPKRDDAPKTPEQRAREAPDPSAPQQRTKDPKDPHAKWPGGGPKGEDE